MNEAVKYLNSVSYVETGDDLETIETVTISEATHAAHISALQAVTEVLNLQNKQGLIEASDVENLINKYKKLI
jgi:hypothetical protein